MICTKTGLLLEEDPLSSLLLKGLNEQHFNSFLSLISLTLRLKLCSSVLVGIIYSIISQCLEKLR